MSDENIYDFGFSLMSEDEVKEEEKKLKKVVENESYTNPACTVAR